MLETRENINLMILKLLELKDNIDDYKNNKEDALDKIIENIEICDNNYDNIKKIILDNLVEAREDIFEVKELDNGVEFE